MSISTRLKGFLDESQVPYTVMTHTTAYTAQGVAATMQISGKELAKTVVLLAGEEMILAGAEFLKVSVIADSLALPKPSISAACPKTPWNSGR